jgi:hypothetical protein
MLFAGCLYEAPTPDGGARDWRVDPATGKRFPFDLTVSELRYMKITGVPIRIEHAEAGFKDTTVGKVVDVCVHPKTGYTACKFELHDTVAGRTIRRMITNGSIDSLSLGHLYHHGQKSAMEAKEVSICFKGARSGTRLYKQAQEFDTFKAKMDLSTQEPIVPPADAAAAAAPIEKPADDHSALDLTDLLAACTEGKSDALSTALYSRVADLATQLGSANKAGAEQKANIEELTELKSKLEHERASSFDASSKKAKEVVSVMNALLAEYVGEASSSISGEDDASLLEVAHRIPVLASALASRKMVTSNEALRAQMEQRIKAALGPAMPSLWTEPAAQLTEAAPQAVLASSQHHTTTHEPPAKRSRFYGLSQGQQDALSDLGAFSANGDRPVTKDMFSSGFKGTGYLAQQ